MPEHPLGVHQFALADVPPEPWRNGGGFTRTLAVSTSATEGVVGADAAAEPWRWRVSVATIERDGAFSRFPGVDRTTLLIAGDALALEDTQGALVLRLGLNQMGTYPGEADLYARVTGAPLQCLNVMTVRGQCQARVSVVSESISPAGECLLLVLRGGFSYTTTYQPYMKNMPEAQVLIAQADINLIANPIEMDSLLAVIEILPDAVWAPQVFPS
jgi:environmental stress-induced protein Ves